MCFAAWGAATIVESTICPLIVRKPLRLRLIKIAARVIETANRVLLSPQPAFRDLRRVDYGWLRFPQPHEDLKVEAVGWENLNLKALASVHIASICLLLRRLCNKR